MIDRRVLVAGIAALAALATACSTPAPGTAPGPLPDTVAVSAGAVRGADGEGVRRFHAIPYAAAPVGDRRFAPPAPAAPWTGVRDGTRPGPACAQPSSTPQPLGVEDCLTLDVTAPTAPAQRPRPVLVWLHGGGLSTGTGTELDPTRMATRGDVVVVTVEFRLGPLGFLGHPSLGPEGGTLGFADQQAALRWVRDEIGAFGGDPGNVVLGGQSGGSIGTCAQLLSPGARDLVDGAILQSGSCDTTVPPVSLPGLPQARYVVPAPESAATATDVAARLGCADPATAAACLRALPVERIVSIGAGVTAAAWGGPLLPRDPAEALREPGAVADVPVLAGHNRDEGTVFGQTFELAGQPVTDAGLPGLLTAAFGPDEAPRIEREYPDGPASRRFAQVTGDAFFACPQVRLNAALARRSAPVFGYEFADRTSPGYVPILDTWRDVGASHAAELPYLFDVRDKPISFTGEPRPLTRAQRALGDEMIDGWARFLHTGDPGWPRDEVRTFGAAAGPTDRHCGFWG